MVDDGYMRKYYHLERTHGRRYMQQGASFVRTTKEGRLVATCNLQGMSGREEIQRNIQSEEYLGWGPSALLSRGERGIQFYIITRHFIIIVL